MAWHWTHNENHIQTYLKRALFVSVRFRQSRIELDGVRARIKGDAIAHSMFIIDFIRAVYIEWMFLIRFPKYIIRIIYHSQPCVISRWQLHQNIGLTHEADRVVHGNKHTETDNRNRISKPCSVHRCHSIAKQLDVSSGTHTRTVFGLIYGTA